MLQFLKKLGSGLAGLIIGTIAIPFTILASIPLSYHAAFTLIQFYVGNPSRNMTLIHLFTWGHLLAAILFGLAALATLGMPIGCSAEGYDYGFMAALSYPFFNQPFHTIPRHPHARKKNHALLKRIYAMPNPAGEELLTPEEIENFKQLLDVEDPLLKKNEEAALKKYMDYVSTPCSLTLEPVQNLNAPITFEGEEENFKWHRTYELDELKKHIIFCSQEFKVAFEPERKSDLTDNAIQIKKGYADTAVAFTNHVRDNSAKSPSAPKPEPLISNSSAASFNKNSANSSPRLYRPPTPLNCALQSENSLVIRIDR